MSNTNEEKVLQKFSRGTMKRDGLANSIMSALDQLAASADGQLKLLAIFQMFDPTDMDDTSPGYVRNEVFDAFKDLCRKLKDLDRQNMFPFKPTTDDVHALNIIDALVAIKKARNEGDVKRELKLLDDSAHAIALERPQALLDDFDEGAFLDDARNLRYPRGDEEELSRQKFAPGGLGSAPGGERAYDPEYTIGGALGKANGYEDFADKVVDWSFGAVAVEGRLRLAEAPLMDECCTTVCNLAELRHARVPFDLWKLATADIVELDNEMHRGRGGHGSGVDYSKAVHALTDGADLRNQHWSSDSTRDNLWEVKAMRQNQCFFNMALFPTVLKLDSAVIVRPYAVYYCSVCPGSSDMPGDDELRAAEFLLTHTPVWTKMNLPPNNYEDAQHACESVWVETSLLTDEDGRKSVQSAIMLTRPIPGSFIWFTPFDNPSATFGVDTIALTENGKKAGKDVTTGESLFRVEELDLRPSRRLQINKNTGNHFALGGASLGLACVACFLNMPRIAYTGFIRRIGPDFVPVNQQSDEVQTDIIDPKLGDLVGMGSYNTKAQQHTVSMKPGQFPDNNYRQKEFSQIVKAANLVRIGRGSDIVEEVDLVSFKTAWANCYGFPLVIPHMTMFEKPMIDIFNSPTFDTRLYLLAQCARSYTMPLEEEGITYADNPTPTLIAASVPEAALLASYAYLYAKFDPHHESNPLDRFHDDPMMQDLLKMDFANEWHDLAKFNRKIKSRHIPTDQDQKKKERERKKQEKEELEEIRKQQRSGPIIIPPPQDYPPEFDDNVSVVSSGIQPPFTSRPPARRPRSTREMEELYGEQGEIPWEDMEPAPPRPRRGGGPGSRRQRELEDLQEGIGYNKPISARTRSKSAGSHRGGGKRRKATSSGSYCKAPPRARSASSCASSRSSHGRHHSSHGKVRRNADTHIVASKDIEELYNLLDRSASMSPLKLRTRLKQQQATSKSPRPRKHSKTKEVPQEIKGFAKRGASHASSKSTAASIYSRYVKQMQSKTREKRHRSSSRHAGHGHGHSYNVGDSKTLHAHVDLMSHLNDEAPSRDIPSGADMHAFESYAGGSFNGAKVAAGALAGATVLGGLYYIWRKHHKKMHDTIDPELEKRVKAGIADLGELKDDITKKEVEREAKRESLLERASKVPLPTKFPQVQRLLEHELKRIDEKFALLRKHSNKNNDAFVMSNAVLDCFLTVVQEIIGGFRKVDSDTAWVLYFYDRLFGERVFVERLYDHPDYDKKGSNRSHLEIIKSIVPSDGELPHFVKRDYLTEAFDVESRHKHLWELAHEYDQKRTAKAGAMWDIARMFVLPAAGQVAAGYLAHEQQKVNQFSPRAPHSLQEKYFDTLDHLEEADHKMNEMHQSGQWEKTSKDARHQIIKALKASEEEAMKLKAEIEDVVRCTFKLEKNDGVMLTDEQLPASIMKNADLKKFLQTYAEDYHAASKDAVEDFKKIGVTAPAVTAGAGGHWGIPVGIGLGLGGLGVAAYLMHKRKADHDNINHPGDRAAKLKSLLEKHAALQAGLDHYERQERDFVQKEKDGKLTELQKSQRLFNNAEIKYYRGAVQKSLENLYASQGKKGTHYLLQNLKPPQTSKPWETYLQSENNPKSLSGGGWGLPALAALGLLGIGGYMYHKHRKGQQAKQRDEPKYSSREFEQNIIGHRGANSTIAARKLRNEDLREKQARKLYDAQAEQDLDEDEMLGTVAGSTGHFKSQAEKDEEERDLAQWQWDNSTPAEREQEKMYDPRASKKEVAGASSRTPAWFLPAMGVGLLGLGGLMYKHHKNREVAQKYGDEKGHSENVEHLKTLYHRHKTQKYGCGGPLARDLQELDELSQLKRAYEEGKFKLNSRDADKLDDAIITVRERCRANPQFKDTFPATLSHSAGSFEPHAQNYGYGRYVPPFSGEYHLPQHNYTGPGTAYKWRKAHGVKPTNAVDAASMEHDGAYADLKEALMEGKVTREVARKLVRDVDEELIRRIQLIPDEVQPADHSGPVVIALIKKKMAFEDRGWLDPLQFVVNTQSKVKGQLPPKAPWKHIIKELMHQSMETVPGFKTGNEEKPPENEKFPEPSKEDVHKLYELYGSFDAAHGEYQHALERGMIPTYSNKHQSGEDSSVKLSGDYDKRAEEVVAFEKAFISKYGVDNYNKVMTQINLDTPRVFEAASHVPAIVLGSLLGLGGLVGAMAYHRHRKGQQHSIHEDYPAGFDFKEAKHKYRPQHVHKHYQTPHTSKGGPVEPTSLSGGQFDVAACDLHPSYHGLGHLFMSATNDLPKKKMEIEDWAKVSDEIMRPPEGSDKEMVARYNNYRKARGLEPVPEGPTKWEQFQQFLRGAGNPVGKKLHLDVDKPDPTKMTYHEKKGSSFGKMIAPLIGIVGLTAAGMIYKYLTADKAVKETRKSIDDGTKALKEIEKLGILPEKEREDMAKGLIENRRRLEMLEDRKGDLEERIKRDPSVARRLGGDSSKTIGWSSGGWGDKDDVYVPSRSVREPTPYPSSDKGTSSVGAKTVQSNTSRSGDDGFDWSKLLLGVLGTAALGGLLYYGYKRWGGQLKLLWSTWGDLSKSAAVVEEKETEIGVLQTVITNFETKYNLVTEANKKLEESSKKLTEETEQKLKALQTRYKENVQKLSENVHAFAKLEKKQVLPFVTRLNELVLKLRNDDDDKHQQFATDIENILRDTEALSVLRTQEAAILAATKAEKELQSQMQAKIQELEAQLQHNTKKVQSHAVVDEDTRECKIVCAKLETAESSLRLELQRAEDTNRGLKQQNDSLHKEQVALEEKLAMAESNLQAEKLKLAKKKVSEIGDATMKIELDNLIKKHEESTAELAKYRQMVVHKTKLLGEQEEKMQHTLFIQAQDRDRQIAKLGEEHRREVERLQLEIKNAKELSEKEKWDLSKALSEAKNALARECTLAREVNVKTTIDTCESFGFVNEEQKYINPFRQEKRSRDERVAEMKRTDEEIQAAFGAVEKLQEVANENAMKFAQSAQRANEVINHIYKQPKQPGFYYATLEAIRKHTLNPNEGHAKRLKNRLLDMEAALDRRRNAFLDADTYRNRKRGTHRPYPKGIAPPKAVSAGDFFGRHPARLLQRITACQVHPGYEYDPGMLISTASSMTTKKRTRSRSQTSNASAKSGGGFDWGSLLGKVGDYAKRGYEYSKPVLDVGKQVGLTGLVIAGRQAEMENQLLTGGYGGGYGGPSSPQQTSVPQGHHIDDTDVDASENYHPRTSALPRTFSSASSKRSSKVSSHVKPKENLKSVAKKFKKHLVKQMSKHGKIPKQHIDNGSEIEYRFAFMKKHPKSSRLKQVIESEREIAPPAFLSASKYMEDLDDPMSQLQNGLFDDVEEQAKTFRRSLPYGSRKDPGALDFIKAVGMGSLNNAFAHGFGIAPGSYDFASNLMKTTNSKYRRGGAWDYLDPEFDKIVIPGGAKGKEDDVTIENTAAGGGKFDTVGVPLLVQPVDSQRIPLPPSEGSKARSAGRSESRAKKIRKRSVSFDPKFIGNRKAYSKTKK